MGRKLSSASGSRTALLQGVRFSYHFCFLIPARPVSRLDSSNIVQALTYRGFKQFLLCFCYRRAKVRSSGDPNEIFENPRNDGRGEIIEILRSQQEFSNLKPL